MTSVLMSPKSAAEYLDLPSAAAVDIWAKRNGVPAKYLGTKTKRYLKADLDRAREAITLRVEARRKVASF